MKRILIFMTLAVLLCACKGEASGDLIPVLKFDGMRGDVAKVKEWKYDVQEKFGEFIKGDVEGMIESHFSQDGHKIKEISYGGDGDREYTAVYEYDGILCTYYKKEYESSHMKDQNHEVKCEIDGNQVTETVFREGETKVSTFTYEMGPLYLKLTDSKGDEQRFYFDQAGRLLRSDAYTNTTYKYDSNGDLIYVHNEGGDSEGNTYTITYEYLSYDEKGNWLTAVYSFNDNKEFLERNITYR